MRVAKIYTAVLALVLGLSTAALAAPVIQIDTGKVSGIEENGVAVFKGIPYAKPPVGALRWRAPQPVGPWDGVKNASVYGADCMQLPYRHDAAPLGVAPSEDCLYLNVWSPMDKSVKKRPVMVWIYGGGFVNGGSSPPLYAGDAFAKSDVVFVSFNYRIGRFGFFSHPALTAEAGDEPLGNYGILDQIAALKWVKRNIEAFGGDPDNVTVFGESAGGLSVHLLMTSSMSRGLFSKAIVQSGGGGRQMLGTTRTLSDAEAEGLAFAKDKNIHGQGSDAIQKLRNINPEEVIDGLNLMTLFGSSFTGPFIDGKVITAMPVDIHKSAEMASVPLVIGANSSDGFFMNGTLDQAYAPVGAAQAQAEMIYDPQGTQDAARIGMEISADTMMIEPTRTIARILATKGSKVYLYRFDYVPEYLRGKFTGALHASEIPFVFDAVSVRHGDAVSVNDNAMARLVHEYWVNFAKTGRPEVAGRTPWPQNDPGADVLMQFTNKGAHVRPDPFKIRLDFIEGLHQAAAR